MDGGGGQKGITAQLKQVHFSLNSKLINYHSPRNRKVQKRKIHCSYFWFTLPLDEVFRWPYSFIQSEAVTDISTEMAPKPGTQSSTVVSDVSLKGDSSAPLHTNFGYIGHSFLMGFGSPTYSSLIAFTYIGTVFTVNCKPGEFPLMTTQ